MRVCDRILMGFLTFWMTYFVGVSRSVQCVCRLWKHANINCFWLLAVCHIDGNQRGHVLVFFSSAKWVSGTVVTDAVADVTLYGNDEFAWFGWSVGVTIWKAQVCAPALCASQQYYMFIPACTCTRIL